MRRYIENPRIVLLDCPLEYKKGESQTALELSNQGSWSRALEIEEEQVKEICMNIIALKPDLVITEKGVSDLAQHYFVQANITALRRVRKTDNHRISKATGAVIVSRPEDLKESDIGTGCGLFRVDKIADEYFCTLEKCSSPKACSIVLRGPSKDIINELERDLQDALCVARNLYYTPSIVPGGGSIEMTLSVALAEKSRHLQGLGEMASIAGPYRILADALEVIPRTLIANCGGDRIRTMTTLRAQHASGDHPGIDGLTGKIISSENGVWEPVAVKLQTLQTAVEASCMLLRVDDILSGLGKKESKPSSEPTMEQDHSGHGHD